MSKFTIAGIISTEELNLVGYGRFAKQSELATIIPNDLIKIASYSEIKLGRPLCVYKSFNMEDKNVTILNTFIALKGSDRTRFTAEGGMLATIPAQQQVLKIVYHGAYETIDSAWIAGFQYLLDHDLKHNCYNSPWEIYIEGPYEHKNNSDNYITEIYIPINS